MIDAQALRGLTLVQHADQGPPCASEIEHQLSNERGSTLIDVALNFYRKGAGPQRTAKFFLFGASVAVGSSLRSECVRYRRSLRRGGIPSLRSGGYVTLIRTTTKAVRAAHPLAQRVTAYDDRGTSAPVFGFTDQ